MRTLLLLIAALFVTGCAGGPYNHSLTTKHVVIEKQSPRTLHRFGYHRSGEDMFGYRFRVYLGYSDWRRHYYHNHRQYRKDLRKHFHKRGNHRYCNHGKYRRHR